MTTLKIKPTHPSQGEFVIIEKKDFDPAKHELLEGESLGDATGDTVAAGDGVPTLAELIAATKQLHARNDELDDRELALAQRSDSLDDREQAALEREQTNAAEAQRLANLAAGQSGAGGAPDYSSMSKEQLQAALDAKGTKYPAAANKAELIALLAGA